MLHNFPSLKQQPWKNFNVSSQSSRCKFYQSSATILLGFTDEEQCSMMLHFWLPCLAKCNRTFPNCVEARWPHG